MNLLRHIDRVIGFEADNQIAAEFGRERIRAVRSFIHLYYLTILAPYAALAWLYWDQTVTKVAGTIFLLAVALRFRHWLFPVPEGQSEDVNPVAARVTGAMVVLLSCTQAAFYLSLAFTDAQLAPAGFGWLQFLFLGLLAAVVQGAALTGIIFASRVIFFCFVLPQVIAVLYLFGTEYLLESAAIVVLTAISLYLAETSHQTQLSLFKAQYDADLALLRMEKTNVELSDARKLAQHQAETDSLTGVRSRSAFIDDVEAMLGEGARGLLAVIDLDRFKPINDLHGHHAGDIVLKHVARRLRRTLPNGAIVGRLGGDEFGLFMQEMPCASEKEQILALIDAALAELRKPMRLANSTVSVGASAGARILGKDQTGVGRAMRDADAALYVAKREGLDNAKLFDEKIRKKTQWLHEIEADLMKVATVDELYLAYQPILNLRTGELASFEALARWRHPTFGEISPTYFIPAAERLGRIGEITLSLLAKALDFAADWSPPSRLSFNLSAAHICCEGAAEEIVALIESKGFPTHRLQFEITETAMLVNFEVARANVEILRGAGCRIALDDFGAGFASLLYLREIKFDKVKIDGSLIQRAREPEGREMLRGVIKLIEAMNLESVAEYIATVDDRETAVELGAVFGQGFYLGRPLNERDVLDLLAKSGQPRSQNIHSLSEWQYDDDRARSSKRRKRPARMS